jgi:hypothetical protein
MKKNSVVCFVILVLSLFIFGCGGSGSSTSTATGATVLVTADNADGSSLSTFSNYSSNSFTPATASFTLTSEIFSGALYPSSVTVNSIDISYTPLEYDATLHLFSPQIGTIYHRSIGGVIPAGGSTDFTDIVIFSSLVGVQNNANVTTLLDSGYDLPYTATVYFNMNEDTTNSEMRCTATVELHLSK